MNAPLDKRTTTNMTSKGQVLIPKDVRQAIGLIPGSPVDVGVNDRGEAVVVPVAQPRYEMPEQRSARLLAVLAEVRTRYRTGRTTEEIMYDLRGDEPPAVIFFDSNILIDLFGEEGANRQWSQAIYARAARGDPIVSNLIVLAEIAAGFEDSTNVMRDLENLSIEIVELQTDAVLLSAGAFREYRRRSGSRERILPDFLIAAHAAALGATLVTRDRRLASYFPDLILMTPETHPNG